MIVPCPDRGARFLSKLDTFPPPYSLSRGTKLRHDCTHVIRLLISAGEASSVWRNETLRDLEWRARCLGLEGNPEVQGLLAQLLEQSSEVESLWQKQQDPSYQAPWWADGDYDDTKADMWVIRIRIIHTSPPPPPPKAFPLLTPLHPSGQVKWECTVQYWSVLYLNICVSKTL